jgi:hypothetical protein
MPVLQFAHEEFAIAVSRRLARDDGWFQRQRRD